MYAVNNGFEFIFNWTFEAIALDYFVSLGIKCSIILESLFLVSVLIPRSAKLKVKLDDT